MFDSLSSFVRKASKSHKFVCWVLSVNNFLIFAKVAFWSVYDIVLLCRGPMIPRKENEREATASSPVAGPLVESGCFQRDVQKGVAN